MTWRGPTLALFRKNKTDGGGAVQRDPGKARAWFDRATAVADTRQYDYAIECYINGLRLDPGNRAIHEELREVALKRKVASGKPARLTERFKSPGSQPVDKMLHAEKLWSKDPLNLSLMLQTMKLAVTADQAEPDSALAEVAYWIGDMALDNNQTSKKPDKAVYLELRDLLSKIEAYDKAVLACQLALQTAPNDAELLNELKDLEAENTMKQGGYADTKGDFRESVRDLDKQRELAQEDAISKTESALADITQRRRKEYEENTSDLDRLQKFVDALVQNETEATEDEAIQLLQNAHEQTGQYRYKVRIGDLRMKQMASQYRQLKTAADNNPQDAEVRSRSESLYREKVAFELDEYADRVKNYPTDLGLKYQLGIRLFAFKKYDDAISAFQQAKSDPKYRAASHDYLGRCYLTRGWFDEAVDTFRQGIEVYPITDDRLGKELRYQLMDALATAAAEKESLEQAREAQKIASQLVQTDIGYRDIRDRIDALRQLVDKLQKKE